MEAWVNVFQIMKIVRHFIVRFVYIIFQLNMGYVFGVNIIMRKYDHCKSCYGLLYQRYDGSWKHTIFSIKCRNPIPAHIISEQEKC